MGVELDRCWKTLEKIISLLNRIVYRGASRMESPWKVELPLAGTRTDRVVIYSYKDKWNPVTFSPFAEAINLYHTASFLGEKIFLFPPDLDPRIFEIV
jgi:hypothetical protein